MVCVFKVNRKKMEVETVRDSISSAGRAEMKLRAESELHESRIHKRAEDALRVKAQHPEIRVALTEDATVAQVRECLRFRFLRHFLNLARKRQWLSWARGNTVAEECVGVRWEIVLLPRRYPRWTPSWRAPPPRCRRCAAR